MKKTILILFLFPVILYSQESKDPELSGILGIDRFTVAGNVDINSDSLSVILQKRKSPFLAAFLSAMVPGAGQFYNEDYLKAGIFFLIDAAALTTAVIYEGKGDDKTEFFESYALDHWDVERYAEWTINNAVRLNSSIDPNDSDLFDVFDSNGNIVWSRLNRLENAIGGYYSHQLAGFREQQYFEMIGKYAQFNPGWDDFSENPEDPFTYTHDRKDPLTDRFIYYSGQRGEANDFYNIASKAVLVVVINHIINAAEAAWSASRYNKSLKMSVSLQKKSIGFVTDHYPVFNLNINL